MLVSNQISEFKPAFPISTKEVNSAVPFFVVEIEPEEMYVPSVSKFVILDLTVTSYRVVMVYPCASATLTVRGVYSPDVIVFREEENVISKGNAAMLGP